MVDRQQILPDDRTQSNAVAFTFYWLTDPAYRGRLPVQLFRGQCGDEMMLLYGLSTKNRLVFSWPSLPFLQIGGNEPQYEEFRPRTLWSLSNAFTSAFKELDPIPQFKATAKLGAFLEERFARKF